MPVLSSKNRKTIEVEFPSYPGSKVVVFTSLLVGQTIDIKTVDGSIPAGEMLKSLPNYIKEWNFTDEDNKTLEITEANCRMLNATDVIFLLKKINEVTGDPVEKKS